MRQGLTPSQTVGPYFRIGLERLYSNDLVPAGSEAQAITISGQLRDGEDKPIPDAVFEIWQADQAGQYACLENTDPGPPAFPGWGRFPTDPDGHFHFRTVKPGPVREPGGLSQAPHINVAIFMRGLLRHLYTRIYFEDEAANKDDAILQAVPEHRRHTLVAQLSRERDQHYRWQVVMQGAGETVFFDW